LSQRSIAPAPSTTITDATVSQKNISVKKLLRWNRKAHRWVALIIAFPMLFIILTGIFLQVRKPIDWIQPPSADGSAKYQPTVVLEQVLENVKAVPAMQVNGWSDIKLLDLRPKNGIIKVRNFDELETQVDATTGAVLQTAQRRNDFVVKMHDFSAWNARLWLGLPIRLGFLALFLTGVWLNIKMTPPRVKQLFKKQSATSIKAKLATDNNSVATDNFSVAEAFNEPAATTETSSHLLTKTNAEIRPEIRPDLRTETKPKRLRLKAMLMKYHYWLGWFVIIPWAFVIFSGLLLQVRYEVPWVMPPLQQGVGSQPQIEFVQVLAAAQQTPDSGVAEWKDVWRMYVYPDKGVTTIRAKNKQETQIDSQTGQVLQVATRRTDWLEDIHEGKWMDLNLKLFLPVHILSLFLWLTGTVVAFKR